MGYTREVRASVDKATDMQIHVSNVTSEAYGDFTEIREYIPSLDQYGRGVVFPVGLTDDVIEGLQKVLR